MSYLQQQPVLCSADKRYRRLVGTRWYALPWNLLLDLQWNVCCERKQLRIRHCWSTTLLLIKRIKTSWRDLTLVMSCSYLISRCRCLFSNGIVHVSAPIRSQNKTAALNSNNLLIAIVKLAVVMGHKKTNINVCT